MICELCTIPKSWNGADRQCAFSNGTFSPDNWNCGTMNVFRKYIREIVDETRYNHIQYCDDQQAIIIPIGDGEFLTLGWYKSRGKTEFAGILCEDKMENLKISKAVDIIRRQRMDTTGI